MPESPYHEAKNENIIAVRFRMKASVDEVVARILDSVRQTDLTLLTVFGDGDHLYPDAGRNPDRRASSWRAELFWRSRALNAGWHLEVFLKRAEFFLEVPGGVALEMGAGQRNPREDVRGVSRATLLEAADEGSNGP